MINEFFGFSENPFHLTPDPRFLFLTDSHQEALASMIYGIQERKGFVSVSGEVGTGKTTLVRHLLNTLGSQIQTVPIYQTLLTFDELLKEILLELDLPLGDQSKTFLIRQLNDYLVRRLSRNEIVALIIDEAQNLTKEVLEGLRLLSNLETERFKLMQIVLVGQPELEEKLNSDELRQFKQRIAIRRQIRPLTGEESRRYIEHRLDKVGSSSLNVFTPEALALICQYAEGIPRVINLLCDNSFLIGYALKKRRIDGPVVREVLSDMGILLREKSPDEKITPSPESIEAGPVSSPDALLSPASEGNGASSTQGAGETARPEDRPGPRTYLVPAPEESSLHKKAAMIACGVLILALVLFFGKVYWQNARENVKHLPSPPPPAAPAKEPSPISPKPESQAKEPTSISPKPGSQAERILSVKRGDTVSNLAQQNYGFSNYTLMDYILTANPEITNPHRIWEDQNIRVPAITEDSLVLPGGDGTYVIWLGTFPDRQQAVYLAKKLSVKGMKIELHPRPVGPQETWYRAMTGKFPTRDEGLKTVQGLRETGLLEAFRK